MKKIKTIILIIILLVSISFAEETKLINLKPTEIDSLLRVNAKKGLTITERINLYSEMFLGTEYSWTPTGDGSHALYEPQPLFSFTQSNCMVLCEHSLALAISDSWDNFFNNLQQIRYRDGVIGMKTRNHYTMADWVPENSWILDDVTKKVGEKYTEKTTRHISYSTFFGGKNLADLRYIKPDADYTINYIKWKDIPKIKHNIKQGDILAMILKDKDDIFSGHMILAVEVDGKLFIREASTSKMTTFQTDFDEWIKSDYAKKKYCGIIVTRVKENLNKKDAVVLPWKIQDLKGMIKTNYKSPKTLMNDYLQKDANGEFLRQNEWKNVAMYNPESMPAWDNSTLIKSYKITNIEINLNKAFIDIEYEKIAGIDQNADGFYLNFGNKIEKHTFELRKTETGWKIVKPIINQHIYKDFIIDKLPEKDVKALSKYFQ